VGTALDGLAADGLVDDRRAAAAHLRTGSRVKGRGRFRLIRELEARGIDRDLAAELVAALPADEEAAAIDRILVRRRLAGRLTAAEHRRLFEQLLRRGFPPDTIADALKKRGLTR
jgi:SOS response regulatory protein OraA/RecX